MRRAALALGVLHAALTASPCAYPRPLQNVVDANAEEATAPAVTFEANRLRSFLWMAPRHGGEPRRPEAARVARALERHVREFLDGFPFRPFHVTLGISGYETVFGHPDEMFYALSVATPYLSEDTASRTRAFLAKQLATWSPYVGEGFEPRVGRPRESYTVPDALRAKSRNEARNTFGVFALWAYSHSAGGTGDVASHWSRVRERMEPILGQEYRFDISRRHDRDETERFTGDLAGVIGCLRLARAAGDGDTEKRALRRALQMLSLRINLDRVNPRILEVSKSAASHQLHMSKLARYVDLAPCVGKAVAELTDGVAESRLASFRGARGGWYTAFGPRLIGGENYTSPTHLSRAMFDAATFIERLETDRLLRLVDIPWCPGDYYFMVKCAYALWADGGRRWEMTNDERRRG